MNQATRPRRSALAVIAAVLAALLLPAPDRGTATAQQAARRDARPNIVLIVADDLGYSDLGVYGGEIPTPNLDGLARGGMMLTQFYANVTCSPTRAMLMSGMDNHRAGLGVMGPPAKDSAQYGKPGYEGHLNFRVASLPELMRDAGYHTYMTGKWHLGRTKETSPRGRGFEQVFASLDGAAHLGSLSWNGPKASYFDGDELVNVGDEFYTTRDYTTRMIDFIERDRQDGKPFFAWLAYTAPHWPLQAPKEAIAKFKGKYDAGWEALYQSRFARAKELGVIGQNYVPVPPVAGQPRWEELSADERAIEARKMEVYAAMVAELDVYVGQVIEYLKKSGQYDNTMIVFLSDNGAEYLRRDTTEMLKKWVDECCDNSLGNLGAGNSYVMYGPNWARAGSVAYNRSKGTTYEGGFRVPAFVHFPKAVAGGTRSNALGTVMDLLPTFLEVAGSRHPGTSFQGREVMPPTGKSLWPLVTGKVAQVHAADEVIGWELYGHRTVRQGDWKIVWDATERDKATWHLFNLASDPSEQRDLAAREPQRLQTMIGLWDEYHRINGLVP